MNAREYCEIVEQRDRLQKQLLPTIPITENNSPLISLKQSGFNLIFEPSIKTDYRYLVRAEIVEKVGRISKLLDKQDKTLIIRSAWRSFEHQQLLWKYYSEMIQKEQPDKSIDDIDDIVSGFLAAREKSMIDLTHGQSRSCDGLSRREMLRLGTLGILGLSLPDCNACCAAPANRCCHCTLSSSSSCGDISGGGALPRLCPLSCDSS